MKLVQKRKITQLYRKKLPIYLVCQNYSVRNRFQTLLVNAVVHESTVGDSRIQWCYCNNDANEMRDNGRLSAEQKARVM